MSCVIDGRCNITRLNRITNLMAGNKYLTATSEIEWLSIKSSFYPDYTRTLMVVYKKLKTSLPIYTRNAVRYKHMKLITHTKPRKYKNPQ